MEAVDKIKKYVKNLYIRYILVNELYMVDVWEQIVVHIVLLTVFIMFWYFNYHFIMNGINQIRNQSPSSPHIEAV